MLHLLSLKIPNLQHPNPFLNHHHLIINHYTCKSSSPCHSITISKLQPQPTTPKLNLHLQPAFHKYPITLISATSEPPHRVVAVLSSLPSRREAPRPSVLHRARALLSSSACLATPSHGRRRFSELPTPAPFPHDTKPPGAAFTNTVDATAQSPPKTQAAIITTTPQAAPIASAQLRCRHCRCHL
jgi:hypothetical protein